MVLHVLHATFKKCVAPDHLESQWTQISQSKYFGSLTQKISGYQFFKTLYL